MHPQDLGLVVKDPQLTIGTEIAVHFPLAGALHEKNLLLHEKVLISRLLMALKTGNSEPGTVLAEDPIKQ
jgi:hypothetical protein